MDAQVHERVEELPQGVGARPAGSENRHSGTSDFIFTASILQKDGNSTTQEQRNSINIE
jgi:hypothetical protein